MFRSGVYPNQKVVKNRMHFDIVVDDVEVATSRIVALGGRDSSGAARGEPQQRERWLRDRPLQYRDLPYPPTPLKGGAQTGGLGCRDDLARIVEVQAESA
jgi:hypothetical protein